MAESDFDWTSFALPAAGLGATVAGLFNPRIAAGVYPGLNLLQSLQGQGAIEDEREARRKEREAAILLRQQQREDEIARRLGVVDAYRRTGLTIPEGLQNPADITTFLDAQRHQQATERAGKESDALANIAGIQAQMYDAPDLGPIATQVASLAPSIQTPSARTSYDAMMKSLQEAQSRDTAAGLVLDQYRTAPVQGPTATGGNLADLYPAEASPEQLRNLRRAARRGAWTPTAENIAAQGLDASRAPGGHEYLAKQAEAVTKQDVEGYKQRYGLTGQITGPQARLIGVAGSIPGSMSERDLAGMATGNAPWDLPFATQGQAQAGARQVQGNLVGQDVAKQGALLPGQIRLAQATAQAQLPVEVAKAQAMAQAARAGRAAEPVGMHAHRFIDPKTLSHPLPNMPMGEVTQSYREISEDAAKGVAGFKRAVALIDDIERLGTKLFDTREATLFRAGRLSAGAWTRANPEAATFERQSARFFSLAQALGNDGRISDSDFQIVQSGVPGYGKFLKFRESPESFRQGLDELRRAMTNNMRATIGAPPDEEQSAAGAPKRSPIPPGFGTPRQVR